MSNMFKKTLLLLLIVLIHACTQNNGEPPLVAPKHRVIFDTDANNELDDQHALAYLLLNGDAFTVRGITVNATDSGGEIANHYREAERILKLCNQDGKIPLLNGANADFDDIKEHIAEDQFDGHAAVNFIIEEALKSGDDQLVLIPVGKLTNIALALRKEPAIAGKIRIVWLGSNYPAPGEYNQDNDIPSMNYVLSTPAPFEMVTVRYGESSGTAAITVTQSQINDNMPGRGPQARAPVTGRHGGQYDNFGDYAVSLFQHIYYYNEARERALFDLAAVAVVKNPGWGQARMHPRPVFRDSAWIEQPGNDLKMKIWENFDKESIVKDLYHTLDNPVYARAQ